MVCLVPLLMFLVLLLLEFCSRFEVSLRRVEGLFDRERGVDTDIVFGGEGAWRRMRPAAFAVLFC